MQARRRIDTVLFDIGDTMLNLACADPRPYFAESFRLGHAFLESRGHALPPLRRYARRLRRMVIRRFLWSRIIGREMRLFEALLTVHRRMGVRLTPEEAEALAWQTYLPMRRDGHADEDAEDVLRRLADRGYRLGIISNTATPPTALDRHLEEEGLLAFFPVRVYSCEVGYMKPHPGIFRIALERMGAAAERTAYIGDKAKIDVRGAGRVGLLTVLKSPDGTPASKRDRPDHVIRRLAELPPLLEDYGAP